MLHKNSQGGGKGGRAAESYIKQSSSNKLGPAWIYREVERCGQRNKSVFNCFNPAF